MTNVQKLHQAEDIANLMTGRERTRACITCRFMVKSMTGVEFSKCGVTFEYAERARQYECANGKLWEAKPARVGVLIGLKRWLIG